VLIFFYKIKDGLVKMIKYLSSFVLLLSIIAFASCTKPDIQWGQNLLTVNANTQLVEIDTFKPKISTVYIDSFATSGKNIIIVGNYTDPAFGTVSSQSFLELAPPTYNSSVSYPYQNTIYDSIRLIMKLKKGNYYGDSTHSFHINVHELAEEITYPSTLTTSLYNRSSFAVKPTPLGSGDFSIHPNFTDSVVVKLSNSLGLTLYNKLSNSNDIDVQNSTNFLNYFNGIRISGSSSNTMIMNFNDSVIIRLYYRKKGYYLTDETVDFTFSNSAHQFNNITIDRTGSAINGINTINREIPSETTNNIAYLQASTGSMVKIQFPSLYYLQQLPNFEKLVSAKLIIRPVLNTYSFYTLPSQLRMSVTNTAANDIGNDLVTATSSGGTSTQYGSLYIDYLYGINTAYTYDITNYIKSQLSTNAFYPGNHYGLLLSPPSGSFESLFNRALIGNDKNTSVKIELQIIYAAIQ
jgi:hypothetical protein